MPADIEEPTYTVLCDRLQSLLAELDRIPLSERVALLEEALAKRATEVSK